MDLAEQIKHVMPAKLTGTVSRTVGMTIAAEGFPAPVGALARIDRETGDPLEAEVIGFRDHMTLLYAFSDLAGIRHGNRVQLKRTSRWLRVGDQLLGRVIDAHGNAIDEMPQASLPDRAAFHRQAPHPCTRPRIDTPLSTGIRAIDGLMTCGRGQRVGIFAGSGVGKSVSLGMMARYTDADVIVIALIGERGREVNEFIERDLGPEGRKKSVVVVATSNEPALVRVHAASTATAIAEYFRDQGKDVLLLGRFSNSFRLGATRNRAGRRRTSDNTRISTLRFRAASQASRASGSNARGEHYRVLYGTGRRRTIPTNRVADAVRGLLDGHIWLSRKIAARNHYPAIDVLESLSRLMPEVAEEDHRRAAATMRELMAAHRDHEDLISIGAYRKGANPAVDLAVDMQSEINGLLRQRVEERAGYQQARDLLIQFQQLAAQKLGTMQGASQTAAPAQ